jgi:hypothetical protein
MSLDKDKTAKLETAAPAAQMKSFRSNSDIENFYRFIFDNNLRSEAHTLMAMVLKAGQPKKTRKSKTLH